MKTIIYLHSSKESNLSLGEELGLSEKALETFKYACYEVGIEVEVNEETGETEILGIADE